MGSVVAVIVSMLLLLQFLNNPFHDGIGGLRPEAMERTLKVIDQELTPASVECSFHVTPAATPRRGPTGRPMHGASTGRTVRRPWLWAITPQDPAALLPWR